MIEPRPASATEAVARALRLLADPTNARTGYHLGTGGYRPYVVNGKTIDLPWTQNGDVTGCDCAGLICWAYKLSRHRPGFNAGPWSTVSDDVNTDSMIEDADHARDLFAPTDGAPQPGDVLVYHTITLPDHPGMRWIGHVALVVGTDRLGTVVDYSMLDVVQARGPNGRMPAAIASDGSIWSHHDLMWPRPEWRSRLLRVVP
jgi:cell wall-associated NlpC family hydrolase